jgi:hypothetical protein
VREPRVTFFGSLLLLNRRVNRYTAVNLCKDARRRDSVLTELGIALRAEERTQGRLFRDLNDRSRFVAFTAIERAQTSKRLEEPIWEEYSQGGRRRRCFGFSLGYDCDPIVKHHR